MKLVMNDGFYSPEIGYFEVIGGTAFTPPNGTIKTPQKPSPDHVFDGSKWVLAEVVPDQIDAFPDLTARQFAWMLAYTGLGDVWDKVELQLKDDRAQYAAVKSARSAGRFKIGATLEAVKMLKPVAQAVAPDTDLSEGAIRAAWKLALKEAANVT